MTIESTPKPKIETVTTSFGEVSFSAERGCIITSIKLGDKEILYLDEQTFNNRGVNVKGGIPILFPNAGPIPNELKQEPLGGLPQHGFVRNSQKWTSRKTENGFAETLVSDSETKKTFPYDFELSIVGNFEEDGSFTITQLVKNRGQEDMSLSMGLHPYFRVPHAEKQNIQFDFPGGNLIKENIDSWANGKAFTMDNPKSLDPTVVLEVSIPSLGVFIFD